MATVKEIYCYLDQIAPFRFQEGFDNAGFLVGRSDSGVERILVALDITQDVVREAKELDCQLIVAHHPVIFHPAKRITDESVNGRILLELIEHKVAAICAHTNLDAVYNGVNDCLARVLNLSEVEPLTQEGEDEQGRPYGIGRIGLVHQSGLTAGMYAAYVKEKLQAASVRFADGGHPVSKVAVGGGSCGSMLREAAAAGCDTFVTADVKYDQYLEAKAMGITLMDAGHFATENVVCAPLAQWLTERYPDVEVIVSKTHAEVYSGV